jgi:xyloglucan-specific endo-beta-1,4-glucanase
VRPVSRQCPYPNYPAGALVKRNLAIAGATWDLWQGTVSSWKVHTFKIQTPVSTVQDLDLVAFFKELQLDATTKCLTSIQAGTEIFEGSGSLNTTSYSCSLQ